MYVIKMVQRCLNSFRPLQSNTCIHVYNQILVYIHTYRQIYIYDTTMFLSLSYTKLCTHIIYFFTISFFSLKRSKLTFCLFFFAGRYTSFCFGGTCVGFAINSINTNMNHGGIQLPQVWHCLFTTLFSGTILYSNLVLIGVVAIDNMFI